MTAWTKLLKKFESIPTPRKMVVDGSAVQVIADDGLDKWRVDVFTTDFETLKKAFKKAG
jgi:hypothetical protein